MAARKRPPASVPRISEEVARHQRRAAHPLDQCGAPTDGMCRGIVAFHYAAGCQADDIALLARTGLCMTIDNRDLIAERGNGDCANDVIVPRET